MPKGALLQQEDHEEAQWHFMEKSCMSTSQNKLMIGNLPKGWNQQKQTIAHLRALADQHCKQPFSEVIGQGPKGEIVCFKLEGDTLYREVNGVRCCGLGGADPSGGIVKQLTFSAKGGKKRGKKKQQPVEAWVEDQAYGVCSMSKQALHCLGSFAFQARVKHNIPDEVKSVEVVHNDVIGSYALVGFNRKLHAAMAQQGLGKEMVGGRSLRVAWAREKWPMWDTTSADLAVYGLGFQLYFYFVKKLAYASLLGLVLGFPLLLGCMRGDALNALQDVAAANYFVSMLANTTIANLGILENDTSADTSLMYREVIFLKSPIDIRDVTMVASLADAFLALIVFVIAFWFEHRHIPAVLKKFNDNVVNADAWAVFVDGLPAWGGSKQDPKTVDREMYSRKVTEHFESILRAHLDPSKVRPGKLVVKRSDKGGKHQTSLCAVLRHVFCGRCGCGRSTRDLHGRILGKIQSNDVKGRRCKVRWLDSAATTQVETCNTDELFDSNLLSRLEQSGCGADSYHRSECLVHEVSLVVDYGGQLAKLKKGFDAKIEALQRAESKTPMSIKKSLFRDKARNKAVTPEILKRVKAEMGINLQPKKQCVEGAFLIFSRSAHRDFILKEYRFSRSWFLRSCCMRRRLCFMKLPIRVREAAPPGDIFWDNMDAPPDVRLQRRLFVFVACIIVIIVVFSFVSWAKQAGATANEDQANACPENEPVTKDSSVDCKCNTAGYYRVYRDRPPGIYDLCEDWLHEKAMAKAISTVSVIIILLTSLAANPLAQRLAKALHPASLTTLEDVKFLISFVLQTLILSMITVLVYWKYDGLDEIDFIGKGAYDSLTPEWYVVVGGPILFTLVVNMLYPFMGALQVPMYFQYLSLCRDRKTTKADLVKLYTPPQFPFALRHAEFLCGFFTMFIFSSGMPILYLFLPLYTFTFYWCDKYALLRASVIPPMYGMSLMKEMVRWLQLAAFLHTIFAVYVYGEPASSPSYCNGCDEDVSVGKLQVSQYHSNVLQFSDSADHLTFFSKLIYVSTIPNFLVALFIVGVYILRWTLYAIGETFGSLYTILMESSDEGGRASKIRKSTTQMTGNRESQQLLSGPFTRAMHELNRLGKASSYDISQAYGYEFLDSTSINNTQNAQIAPGQRVAALGRKPEPRVMPQQQVDDPSAGLKQNRVDPVQGAASWPASKDMEAEEDQEYRVQVGAQGSDEETFDVHPASMEAYDNPSEVRERGNHRKTTIEATLQSNDILGVEIDEGSILVCQGQGFIFERGLVHLNAIIGQVKEGDMVEAAGPPEIEYGYLMLPIMPHGCVEVFSVIKVDGVGSEGGSASESEEEPARSSLETVKPDDVGVGTKLCCMSGTDLLESANLSNVIGKVNKGDVVEAAGTPFENNGLMMLPIYPQGVANLINFQLQSALLQAQSLQPQALASSVTKAVSSKTGRPKSKISSKKKSSS